MPAWRDLRWQLDLLTNVHGRSLNSVQILNPTAELTVVVGPIENSAFYELDLPRVRRRQPFQTTQFIDLLVEFRDRPGQTLRGRLENAPEAIVKIDPTAPPQWLE